MLDIRVGDKVKFKKVDKINGNSQRFVEKGKWYEVTEVKSNVKNAFYIKNLNEIGFYISFTEHYLIKKIKRDGVKIDV